MNKFSPLERLILFLIVIIIFVRKGFLIRTASHEPLRSGADQEPLASEDG